MILRDRDVTVDPSCDNVVDLVLKEMKDFMKVSTVFSSFFEKNNFGDL